METSIAALESGFFVVAWPVIFFLFRIKSGEVEARRRHQTPVTKQLRKFFLKEIHLNER
jgi:hypothetical protein